MLIVYLTYIVVSRNINPLYTKFLELFAYVYLGKQVKLQKYMQITIRQTADSIN